MTTLGIIVCIVVVILVICFVGDHPLFLWAPVAVVAMWVIDKFVPYGGYIIAGVGMFLLTITFFSVGSVSSMSSSVNKLREDVDELKKTLEKIEKKMPKNIATQRDSPENRAVETSEQA